LPRIATTLVLGGALALAVAAGRVIEAIIVGALLLPSLALLVLWFVVRRHDQHTNLG
jgi:hypothetical protein